MIDSLDQEVMRDVIMEEKRNMTFTDRFRFTTAMLLLRVSRRLTPIRMSELLMNALQRQQIEEIEGEDDE